MNPRIHFKTKGNYIRRLSTTIPRLRYIVIWLKKMDAKVQPANWNKREFNPKEYFLYTL